MTNGEIFRAAAQYIREHGWDQGPRGGADEKNVPACILGAVAAVLNIERRDLWRDGLHPIYVLLGKRLQCGIAVGRWNDAPERTVQEVLALLDGLAFDEDLKAAALHSTAENKAPAYTLDPATAETGDSVSQPQLVGVPA